MNCADCRENLVAYAEGLLGRDEVLQCETHLNVCATCRAEHATISQLQERLIARGQTAAEVSVVAPVTRRVRVVHIEPEEDSFVTKLIARWKFGLSAAVGTAAVIVTGFLLFPKTQATAAEVLARGAKAVARLASIHLHGQLRTHSADNFGGINPDGPFVPIELWKQFGPELKWRIEKPERVIVMDGQSTVMLIKPGAVGVKIPQRTTSAFDTEWLHRIANLSNAITNELRNALARGWKLSLAEETGADGRLKSVVTVMAKSGVPDDDYGKNTFIENADTRRVYHFDSESELLEAVQVYLVRPSGEVQIFDLSRIDYNQPMDPDTWNLPLPENVSWAQLSQDLPKLPDNQEYASMTAEQAARGFFEACARKDWDEVAKFMSPVNERMKQYLGGLEIISLGESFTSKTYGGRFVPYEIKIRARALMIQMSNANAAKRYVITGGFGGSDQDAIHWGPELLPNNESYAKMSPLEAARAAFGALAKLDLAEMQKFFPKEEVENVKRQLAEAEKRGVDLRKQMPVIQVEDAVWSEEKSAWLVKCSAVQIKKHNLALRKDNAAGRWQVDGGI